MGYNTSFMLLNDRVDELRGNINVGSVLREMISDLTTPLQHRRHQFGYAGIQVIHCAHADHDQIIHVGGNRGEIVGLGFTLNPLITAAVVLSETKDPNERRRLIRIIESKARLHSKYPVKTRFTI